MGDFLILTIDLSKPKINLILVSDLSVPCF
jgi:hypothetical protein